MLSAEYIDHEALIGRQLFGKPSRMLVGVWIARLNEMQASAFYGSQFFDWCVRTGRQHADPGPDLKRFEMLGMVEQTHMDRAKYYRRVNHPLWDVFCMIDVVLGEVQQPGQRQFYTPTPERVRKMVSELVNIYDATSGTVADD